MNFNKTGIISAALASVCCVGPLLLATLGLGGLGISAFIGEYHWYFIGGSTVVLTFAWVRFLRERRRCATERCEMVNGRLTRVTLPLATLAVVGFMGLNVYTYAEPDPVSSASVALAADQTEAVIPVDGMTCFTCTIAVEGSLVDLHGVGEVVASVQAKSVTVRFDAGQVSLEELVAAVNGTGFRAHMPPKEG